MESAEADAYYRQCIDACTQVIESGRMTKDLARLTEIEKPVVLNSQDFIRAIREEL